jgi:hypothetical protein
VVYPLVSNFSEILSPNSSGNAIEITARRGGTATELTPISKFQIKKYIDISITTGEAPGRRRFLRELPVGQEKDNYKEKSIFSISPRCDILEYVNDVSNPIDRKKFYSDLFSSFNKTRVVQPAGFLYEPEWVRDSFPGGRARRPPHLHPVERGAD